MLHNQQTTLWFFVDAWKTPNGGEGHSPLPALSSWNTWRTALAGYNPGDLGK